MPSAKKEIHWIETKAGKIREFPPSLGSVTGLSVPIGGGYFRLIPCNLTIAAITTVERRSHPAMFYIHPWEIDPEQPIIDGIGLEVEVSSSGWLEPPRSQNLKNSCDRNPSIALAKFCVTTM